jgi:predicted ATP-grasp superfamily ATP-dependent carboligase
MRVLILGGRAPVALDHARRFHAQGWHTYVADSVSCRMSNWSNAVDVAVRLPPPRYALSAFREALRRLVEREHIDLILPTCEEVFYLSRIRSSLPVTCNVFTAPFEQLQSLHSKWTFLSLAQNCGVEVPRSERVEGLDEAREWAAGRAVVLKPEFSRFGVHVRIHPDGIPHAPDVLAEVGPWVVQEYHRGRELCSYSIAVAGRLRAHVVYEPKYRLSGSSSYYFDAVSVPAVQGFVEKIIAKIGFTGQISFDWIQEADGNLCVLECNPRAISGLHLFSVEDPLPGLMYEDKAATVVLQGVAPRMVGAVMLGVGLPTAMRAGRLQSWYNDWRRATDVIAPSHDRKPALGALADLCSFAGLALQSRSSLRAATTRDIEWDGETLEA